VIEMCAHTLTY